LCHLKKWIEVPGSFETNPINVLSKNNQSADTPHMLFHCSEQALKSTKESTHHLKNASRDTTKFSKGKGYIDKKQERSTHENR
jgi:hypothetical protein